MSENRIFLEVKDELERENEADHHEESENYCAGSEFGLQSNCCLCTEGNRIQNSLVEHLQSAHLDSAPIADHNDLNQKLEACNCQDGIKLQLLLINHLFSHLPIVKSEKLEDAVVQETVSEGEESIVEEPRFKSKPSYHKQFNRRDRSPKTERVQREFTQDPNTKMFHCNICRNSYKHKQTVERHLSKEHYTFIVGCNKAADSTISQVGTSLAVSTYFTLEPETKTFYCNFCRNAYKHKQTMERHLAKEHEVKVPKIRLQSRFNVTVKSECAIQTYEERRKKDKNLICDKCGQRFLFRESLRKHLLRHMEPTTQIKYGKTVREKIVCDICAKLVNPSVMKRHFQVHHSDYRPFRCEEPGCTTSFFDVTKFKDHKNIHLNVKPYVCEFCQECFHYASNLRQHKLRHTHPDRFKCNVCSSCFVSTKSLRLHMRLHTDDPHAPKPFACSYDGCEKSFRYLDRLKMHQNTHMNPQETEHKCHICPFITHKRKYLKRHLLRAHDICEGNPRRRVFPISRLDS